MMERSEIGQYHAKLRSPKPGFEVISMTYLNHYLTSTEYEVFAMRALMRDVDTARSSHDIFNRVYAFSPESVEMIFPHILKTKIFVIRLQMKFCISFSHESALVSLSRTDVIIKIRNSKLMSRILSTKDFILTMKIKQSQETNAIALNDQSGYFVFGNPNPAFVAVRQAIRGIRCYPRLYCTFGKGRSVCNRSTSPNAACLEVSSIGLAS